MDFKRAQQTTAAAFRDSIVPRLSEYIRIPNKSPLFDADWQQNGHMDRAAELMAAWCREQQVAGLTVEILREAGRTPLLISHAGEGATSDAQTTIFDALKAQYPANAFERLRLWMAFPDGFVRGSDASMAAFRDALARRRN